MKPITIPLSEGKLERAERFEKYWREKYFDALNNKQTTINRKDGEIDELTDEIIELKEQLSDLKADHDALRMVAGNLREAQKKYMADRGNDLKGKVVAAWAAAMDQLLAPKKDEDQ